MKLYHDRNWLYQKYINEKLSMRNIAKICEVDTMAILYFMKKFKIKRRSKSECLLGEKNPRWKGGIGYPNHALMKKLRIQISKETKNKCEICGQEAQELHHIDFSRDNHNRENFIFLCRSCHQIIHINHKLKEKAYSENLAVGL